LNKKERKGGKWDHKSGEGKRCNNDTTLRGTTYTRAQGREKTVELQGTGHCKTNQKKARTERGVHVIAAGGEEYTALGGGGLKTAVIS